MSQTAIKNNQSFLTGVNAEYIAHLYAQFQKSPSQVDNSWREFFNGLNDSELDILREMHGASWTPNDNRMDVRGFVNTPQSYAAIQQPQPYSQQNYMPQPQAEVNSADLQQAVRDSIRAIQLIRAYRVRGHLVADLDPLG